MPNQDDNFRSIGMDPAASGPPQPKAVPSVDSRRLQKLNGYEKLELLGHGAYGEVWKALAPGGVEVAIKIVLLTLDHESTRRELNALEKIRQLHHPFLLQTHSYGMLDDKLTIVMELAEHSLSERFKLRKDEWIGEYPPDDLITYFGQAAEALDYLQSQHVSHRDVKPQNLLFLQGFAKVADFGFARGQDQGMEDASGICGTPTYMAPELWAQRVSRFSDQYSLAATYAHMRLGRLLFDGSFHEVFMQHMGAEPKLDPLPAAEQAVLKKALAKEPDDRYPSCVAFTNALKEATRRPVPKAPPPRSSPWKVPAFAGLFVLLAVLIGVGLFLAYKPSDAGKTQTGPDWLPVGWNADNPADIVADRNGKNYYRRIIRNFDGQTVAMQAIPRTQPDDPPTFYMMQTKVWNDLYARFMADPQSKTLFKKYSSRPGCEQLFSREELWRRGAFVEDPKIGALNPNKPPFFGVEGPRGRLPVFRVTAAEAHCFAESIGGQLPTRKQWLKAAGADEPAAEGESPRVGPFIGPADKQGVAVGLATGPWPVDRAERDLSVHGVYQMAGNGKEWTRDLDDETSTLPLDNLLRMRKAYTLGRSYEFDGPPLTFEDMRAIPSLEPCNAASYEITFRVVLEKD